jgi:hypothetical protein
MSDREAYGVGFENRNALHRGFESHLIFLAFIFLLATTIFLLTFSNNLLRSGVIWKLIRLIT